MSEEITKNLNVELTESTFRKAKSRSGILGLELKEYISKIILDDYNISTAEEAEIAEDITIKCPDCKHEFTDSNLKEIYDCPACGREIREG